MKETINETLDWREQFRKRPLLWSASALGLGVWTGYCIAGVIKGDDTEDVRFENMKRANPEPRRSPAARFANTPEAQASDNGRSEPAEPEGPGLFERFRETAAYDRLEREVASLGNRVVEELSRTAHEVVLPALLVKLKEFIGMDLSSREPTEDRLLSDKGQGGGEREVYGARPATTQSAAAGAGTARTYEAQQGKADRGSGGSALPRPSEA